MIPPKLAFEPKPASDEEWGERPNKIDRERGHKKGGETGKSWPDLNSGLNGKGGKWSSICYARSGNPSECYL